MRILLTFSLLLSMSIPAFSQVEVKPAAFNVDFASFASDSAGLNLLEVYYQVYSSHLLYIRQDGKYVAKYSIITIIKDGKKQISAKESENTLYADTYEDADNQKNFVIDVSRFYVPPGDYKVQVTLKDQNATSTVPLEADLKVPKYRLNQPDISQIEFLRLIENVVEPSVFDKNGWRLVPSCSRRYGDDILSLKFYYEYYDPAKNDDMVKFTYEIRDHKNKVVVSKQVERHRQEFKGSVDSLSLENLKPGSYDLHIYTADQNGEEYISSQGKFVIHWSALQMVENDFDNAVEQLRYIATSAEMKALKNAPKENRIMEWNKFWKSRDPVPDTDENEIKDEYYRRMAYCNKQFEIPNKEGWRTDMGMIYIINGQPDDIERHPFDLETKPYEIWYYYNPRRRFLFIDSAGYGEYILQYPYDGDVTKSIDIYGGRP